MWLIPQSLPYEYLSEYFQSDFFLPLNAARVLFWIKRCHYPTKFPDYIKINLSDFNNRVQSYAWHKPVIMLRNQISLRFRIELNNAGIFHGACAGHNSKTQKSG